jgi:hypothetical protein
MIACSLKLTNKLSCLILKSHVTNILIYLMGFDEGYGGVLDAIRKYNIQSDEDS